MSPNHFFARYLTAFLTDYLPGQRRVSANTVKAYRDVFILFLRYCRDNLGWKPEKITLDQLDVDVIRGFLTYVEKERGCCTRTRNQRLAAFHSFFRYVQVEVPEVLTQVQRILTIPFHRFERRCIRYLEPQQVATLLGQPDLDTPTGRRDAAMLSLLYDSAARVQELVNLRARDVRLESPPHVRLTGKGRKPRIVPLMTNTAKLLHRHMEEHDLNSPHRSEEPLFHNRFGDRLSRSGVRYILEKYVGRAEAAGAIFGDVVSPHTLRHTKAMHLLIAGNPLVIIRDFLGHSDIRTSEVYARANLEMKREALARVEDVSPVVATASTSWQSDTQLIEWLKSL